MYHVYNRQHNEQARDIAYDLLALGWDGGFVDGWA